MLPFARATLVLTTAVLLAGCGGAEESTDVAQETPGSSPTAPTDTGTDSPTDDTPATGEDDPAAAGVVTIGTATTDLGTILVDGEGRTLYVFDNDTGSESSCYDDCAENWPPLTGEVEATGDVDPGLLGSSEREDGTVHVTYGGSPLYYFAADTSAGDVNGQGVGDVWWVVAPDGSKITGDASEDDTGY